MSVALRRADLPVRAGLVLLAGAATGWQAPTLVRVALTAVAVAALGDVLIRTHPDGGRRAVAVSLAAGLVGVLVVGLVLDLVPSGLDARGWAVGLTVLGLTATLALGRRERRPLPAVGEPVRADGLWYAGAAVLVVAGLLIAVSVTRHAERPPVQLFATQAGDGRVVVTVSSPVAAGPYDLWLQDGRTERLLRTAVPIVAGEPLHVPLARFGNRQMRVALRETGMRTDLRYVIVNPDR